MLNAIIDNIDLSSDEADECPRPETPVDDHETQDNHEDNDHPEDLSYKRPESIKTEDKDTGQSEDTGLFRPYCLKDPVEYKYDRHPALPNYPTLSPAFLQYRNIEDLATAQVTKNLNTKNYCTHFHCHFHIAELPSIHSIIKAF